MIASSSRARSEDETTTYASPNSARHPTTKNDEDQTVRRKPTVRVVRLRRSNDISDSTDGVDHLVGEVDVDLRAQARHQHLDDVGLRVEVEVPDVLEDHRLRYRPPCVAHQILEQRELAGLELDFLATARDGTRQQVDDKLADGETCGLGRPARAAYERVNPGYELGEDERLGHVVIAPGVQTANAIVDRPFRAEYDHWRGQLVPAELFDQGQPVQLGQHDVDDRGVVRDAQSQTEPVLTVAGVVDGKARLAETLHHEAGEGRIVLDDQNSHGLPQSASGIPAPRQTACQLIVSCADDRL